MTTTPTIRITGEVAIPLELISDDELERDRERLSVPNPAYVAATRQGSPRAWRLPKSISALEVDATHARYPLGARALIAARLRGKAYAVDDQRPTFELRTLPCSTSASTPRRRSPSSSTSTTSAWACSAIKPGPGRRRSRECTGRGSAGRACGATTFAMFRRSGERG